MQPSARNDFVSFVTQNHARHRDQGHTRAFYFLPGQFQAQRRPIVVNRNILVVLGNPSIFDIPARRRVDDESLVTFFDEQLLPKRLVRNCDHACFSAMNSPLPTGISDVR